MFFIEKHVYFVSTSTFFLRMQGLVNISNEMQEEFQSIVLVLRRCAWIGDLGCLSSDALSAMTIFQATYSFSFGGRSTYHVRNGRDDAAGFGNAVTSVVDSARSWRVVLGVYVMPASSVGPTRPASNFIGPKGGIGNVLSVKKAAHVLRSFVGKILFRKISHGPVAQTSPAISLLDSRKETEE